MVPIGSGGDIRVTLPRLTVAGILATGTTASVTAALCMVWISTPGHQN